MRCGLEYHSGKNCKSELDTAMKEYFQGLDAGSVTNCPQCGLIVEKVAGGCNHITCSKCSFQFCWICGKKYDVEHFDRSNVFGCQGLQESDPSNSGRMICYMFLQLFTIPFTLLFYPVYVLMNAFINPFNMPKKYRFLCFCKDISNNACCGCLIFLFFAPIIFCIGLALGCINLAVFIVPAYINKIYTLLKMLLFWRCLCCLNRHKK